MIRLNVQLLLGLTPDLGKYLSGMASAPYDTLESRAKPQFRFQ
jgi:hypothetical protein